MTTTVRDVMTKDPVSLVRPDQSIDDANQMMKSHDVKRVVVMTDSKLEGIVSLGDLVARGEGEEVQGDLSKAEPNN